MPATTVGAGGFIFPDETAAMAGFGAFTAGLKAQEATSKLAALIPLNNVVKPTVELDEEVNVQLNQQLYLFNFLVGLFFSSKTVGSIGTPRNGYQRPRTINGRHFRYRQQR